MGAPECIVFVRLAEDDEGLAHLDRLPDAEWYSVEDRGRKAGKKDAPRFFRQFRQTKTARSRAAYHLRLHIDHDETSTPCSSAIFRMTASGSSAICATVAIGVPARSMFIAICAMPS